MAIPLRRKASDSCCGMSCRLCGPLQMDAVLGVLYWDATWTAVTGNGWDPTDPQSGNAWENQALFDYGDRALPAMQEYRNP